MREIKCSVFLTDEEETMLNSVIKNFKEFKILNSRIKEDKETDLQETIQILLTQKIEEEYKLSPARKYLMSMQLGNKS